MFYNTLRLSVYLFSAKIDKRKTREERAGLKLKTAQLLNMVSLSFEL